MVEVVQDGQIRAYADFDNRSLPRNPKRTAPPTFRSSIFRRFSRESTPDERIHMARALRSACIDIGFFYLIGHGFTPSKLDAVLAQGRRFLSCPSPGKTETLIPQCRRAGLRTHGRGRPGEKPGQGRGHQGAPLALARPDARESDCLRTRGWGSRNGPRARCCRTSSRR